MVVFKTELHYAVHRMLPTIILETPPNPGLVTNELEIAKKLLTAHNAALLMECLRDDVANTIPLADLCGLILSEKDTDFRTILGFQNDDLPFVTLTTKADWLEVLTALESPLALRIALMAPPLAQHLRVMISEYPMLAYWEMRITPKTSKGQVLDEA